MHVRGSRRSTGRKASLTASALCSATDRVMWGRLLGDVELARLRTPTSVKSSQMRRTPASLSGSNNSSTEWTTSARHIPDPLRLERPRTHRLEFRAARNACAVGKYRTQRSHLRKHRAVAHFDDA